MYAEEDQERRKLVEAKNNAETRVYSLEKLIKEHDEKLSDDDKQAVQSAIDQVKESAKGEDADAINAALEALEQASHALSKHLYENTEGTEAGPGPETASGAAAGSDDQPDDVIDVDADVKE